MRITHIITRLVVGGAQENTIATVLGLKDREGVEVDLISGPTQGPEGSLEASLVHWPELLTIVPQLVRPVHPWKDLFALARLTRLLRLRRPDLVHTHSGKAGVLGRLAAHRAKVPVLLHHIHGPSFGPFQGPVANILFKTAERITGRLTTHFVCSADAMTRIYLEAGIGRPEKYTRIFSGFEIQPFLDAREDPELKRRLGIAPDDFVVGKVARLYPLKGHEALLQAFKLVLQDKPNTRLLFIGGGPRQAALEDYAQQLNVREKVIFVGLIPPSEVPRYVAIIDCLAHLSLREALSRALPQALAGGKPVIAFDFDGADEICIPGETGFLVKTGDIEGVAESILKLAREPTLAQMLGSRGRELVCKEFPVKKMIEKICRLYDTLLTEAGISSSLQHAKTNPAPL